MSMRHALQRAVSNKLLGQGRPSIIPLPTSAASPIAGPSRSTGPFLGHGQTRYITYPHPDLDPSKGTTRIAIRTERYLPSIFHAFAIVRAIEAKYGNVVDVQIQKDIDSLKYAQLVFITLLRPIKVESDTWFEIPGPESPQGSDDLGGPSLADISSVLKTSPKMRAISPPSRDSWTPRPDDNARERGGAERFLIPFDSPIRFVIEKGKNKSSRREKNISEQEARFARYRTPSRSKQTANLKEDREIVRLLREIGGGPFGGFEGLGDRFASLMKADFEALEAEERKQGTGSVGGDSGAQAGATKDASTSTNTTTDETSAPTTQS